ncbi:MAG: biotin-dependent carboxyltransferase family protein [Pseudohongiellaceae bacterium]|nr:biotin-dependent carboxyltransferase family protein [Pseudohongiellaceae bacterium]
MFEILRSSPLTSIQDQGRSSYRHMGVCLAGALDPMASQQANLAVGNAASAAVIEVTFEALQLHSLVDTLIAISGNDFSASMTAGKDQIAQIPVYPGFAHLLKAGSTLVLERPSTAGGRAYIAFAGGIDVPIVMGSRSTDINGGFGGHKGQSLSAGSKLSTLQPSTRQLTLMESLQDSGQHRSKTGIRSIQASRTLRALDGAEAELISPTIRQRFWQEHWRIDPSSNRMGFRLKGKASTLAPYPSLLSSGVLPGDVQLPSDGQPIILGNDAQTTGGYARVAHVIEADRWQLAQLPPNSLIRFTRVSLEEALAAKEQLAQYWQRLALWQTQ